MNMAKFRRVYNNRPFAYKDFSFSDKEYESEINPKVFRIYLRYTETLNSDKIHIDEILFGDSPSNKGVAYDLITLRSVSLPATQLYYEFSSKRISQVALKEFLVDLDFSKVDGFKVCEDSSISVSNIETFVSEYVLSAYRVNKVSEWVKI
jgi:hypothetical protein